MNMRYLLYIFITALVLLTGCNTTGCLENGSALPLAGFYSSDDNSKLTVDSLQISGVGAPDDSVLVRATARNSQVYLPMRPDGGSTSWALEYCQKALKQHGIADTITFYYQSIPYFASSECGAMYAYRVTGLRYTTRVIDSVGLVDSLFTNTDVERIRIYFRTATEGSDQ